MGCDLFLVGRANIFSVYPKIFKDLIKTEDQKPSKGPLRDWLFLPSDFEWQEKVYFRLLDVQREINRMIECGVTVESIKLQNLRPSWDSEYLCSNIFRHTSPSLMAIRKKCVTDEPLDFINKDEINVWSLEDITKAGKLLAKPSIPHKFQDEYEMRTVFSLIYDVFRYKHILGQALHDTAFFDKFSELQSDQNRVWLLLYDLHLRHFAPREPEQHAIQTVLFDQVGMSRIDECLMRESIHLAASITRLRVMKGALLLSHLLPNHLQNEKVSIAAANPIIAGWINPFMIKTKPNASHILTTYGLEECEETEGGETALRLHYFKWDKMCPLFLSCIPNDRSEFARTSIVQNHQFIMQDRAFSLGPSVFAQLLDFYDIEGDVLQTHVSSPRATAYLAALFHSNSHVHNFIAFGAGSRIREYEDYMKQLGVKNVRIYEESFCKIPLHSEILSNVISVFASPPNSYSGILDPIDLICSRGGDLNMLEVLTESEMSDEGKTRVAEMLQCQRDTLRLSMSRPQVQFILYETHSIVPSENEEMVQRAVENANRLARDKHIEIQREKNRLRHLAEQEGITLEQLQNMQPTSSANSPWKKLKHGDEKIIRKIKYEAQISVDASTSESETETDTYRSKSSKMSKKSAVTSSAASTANNQSKLPRTDRFIISEIPNLCIYQDNCTNFKGQGCFLSLVRRKQLTRPNPKYLIKMAERRGIFGDTNPKHNIKNKLSAKKVERKDEKKILLSPSNGKKSKNSRAEELLLLVNRINQPTYCSLKRGYFPKISDVDNKMLYFEPDKPEKCRCFPEDDQLKELTTEEVLSLTRHVTPQLLQ